MSDSNVEWTVVASTAQADGTKIPFQIQVGFAQAPAEDEHAGQWYTVTRSLEPDGSQRKIAKTGPFETKELAEKTALEAAHTLRNGGIPLMFRDGDPSCTCPYCTVRAWRLNTHSLARLLQCVGWALFLVSLTFKSRLADLAESIGMGMVWVGAGMAWSSYSLTKRIMKNASRED
jgi:hypothetical protein